MNNFKSKFLSVLLALVMVVGVLAPAVAKAAPPQPKTNGIVIHKILMPKADLDKHGDEGKDPAYTGGQIKSITGYFGDNAKEIAGVAFDIYMEVDTQGTGKLAHDDAILGGLGTDGKFYELVKDNYMSKTSDYVKLELHDGTYIIVEDKEASTYVGDGKELLAASKAVPTKITLPQAKPDGTGNFTEKDPLHLYPKNTEEKPNVNKTFGDNKTETKDVSIGDEIPYKVDTIIKAGTEYKTLRWTDEMVSGLDFVTGSITVEYGEITNISDKTTYNKTAGLVLNTDYTVTETIRGFTLKLTDTENNGLNKVQLKDKNTMIRITYKGVLNESAEVDTDIPNKVKFEYGNNPSIYDEPLDGKPSEGKITVNKTWADGTAPEGVTATFKVYEKVSGKLVGTITIGATGSGELTGLDNEKEYIVVEDAITGYLPDYTTFENGVLTVVNKKNPNPDEVVPTPPKVKTYGKKFVKTSDSKDNVERLAGAEFVITNSNKSKFLQLKPAGETAQDESAYKAAKDAYIKAINRKNEILAIEEAKRTDAQKTELTTLNGAVETADSILQLEKARNDAYEALNMQWTWTDGNTAEDEKKAFVFVSDEEGRFEVKGLAAGTYHLKETKAPAGYALPSDQYVLGDNGFTVGNNTYTTEGSDIKYNTTDTANGAKKVINKKVTIPQTGGMGTILFTLVGAGLMGSAVFAMKRREREEEEDEE